MMKLYSEKAINQTFNSKKNGRNHLYKGIFLGLKFEYS